MSEPLGDVYESVDVDLCRRARRGSRPSCGVVGSDVEPRSRDPATTEKPEETLGWEQYIPAPRGNRIKYYFIATNSVDLVALRPGSPCSTFFVDIANSPK